MTAYIYCHVTVSFLMLHVYVASRKPHIYEKTRILNKHNILVLLGKNSPWTTRNVFLELPLESVVSTMRLYDL